MLAVMLVECPIESCYVLVFARYFNYLATEKIAGGRPEGAG